MRGFTETDEPYFTLGKLQIRVDRRAMRAALRFVVVGSLRPNQKFAENNGKKKKTFRAHATKLKLKCKWRMKRSPKHPSALTFGMICDHADPRERWKASSGEDTLVVFLSLKI